jgi:hypothetical protein
MNESHTLTGAEYACLGMTVEMCLNLCDVMGFPVAGLEYGGECYCGDNFENEGGVCSGECNVPCIGDNTQMCGGDWKMNVYQRRGVPTVETCAGVVGGCSLGDCTAYNFTGAWTGRAIDWNAHGVLLPNATDVCALSCEVVTYLSLLYLADA